MGSGAGDAKFSCRTERRAGMGTAGAGGQHTGTLHVLHDVSTLAACAVLRKEQSVRYTLLGPFWCAASLSMTCGVTQPLAWSQQRLLDKCQCWASCLVQDQYQLPYLVLLQTLLVVTEYTPALLQADSDHERSSKKAKQSSSSDTNNNQQSLAEQPAVYAAAAPVPALAASQGLTHAMLQQMAVLLQALPAEQLHGLQELLYQQQPSFHQQVQQQLQTAGMVTAGSSLGASGPAGEQEGQRGSRSTSTAVVKEYSTTSLDSAMTGDLSDGVKTEF